MDDLDIDTPAPEFGAFEVACPVCHLTFHGPLRACPTCKELR